ncbi:hypothetical protein GYMLUDRAFT_252996 [Collybiopsis luxurians FD-317 M1]|uniref:CCHC-type domain-containing protein n=1 Tax=Collybiopsis luxurians FD-317 M1 TaxID=944289 RepID=A0A0D0BYE8_9AGAR|nr:hypothetical protein GYMLUDRAFT_252996 [Collybiopsis luxurians FD-317 M1]
MLMSAINPRDKDIHLVKQYKERIHGDVGGSWIIRAQMESVTDELEAAMTTGDPHTSLETQTKQEIFSPRAEHLQAGSSKVCIGGEIPLDAALQLERWAARDKYAILTTHFANETHPVGQYPEQTVTEPDLGCSLWPNHLGFRTDGLTYHRRETPEAFHENNQLEGLGWNARGLILETWPELVNSKTNGRRQDQVSTYRGYGVAGAPGGPPYGGVMQTGGISGRNLERERGSSNGSFRGGSGGGGPGGPGGPGSPGGPPNDPDDWGLNHNAYWHPANGWVAVQGPRGERGEPSPAGQDMMKLNLKKPDPFNGSDRWKWEPFLLQVCRTFMAKPTIYENNSDKIGFAVLYLTGAAATHYNNLPKQEEAGIPVPALCTWIDFVVEFTLYFGLFDPAQDAQEYAFKMGYNDTALNYSQWVQQFQELDNSICATNAAHSRGGNSGFGMYNPMAPLNPQNSNLQQGSNNNNPQQAGGQQGRNQDNISGTVYGQPEDFASASSQNGNSGEGLENQGGNNRVSKNPGDEEFLWAIQAARTPEQVEEFCQCCKLGLCYNCGGSDHIDKDCKNWENWDPPKNGTLSINNQRSDQLRAATFTLEGDPPNDEIWNIEIENNLGKAEGIPETH